MGRGEGAFGAADKKHAYPPRVRSAQSRTKKTYPHHTLAALSINKLYKQKPYDAP